VTNTPLRPARRAPSAPDARTSARRKGPWVVSALLIAGVAAFFAYGAGGKSAPPVTLTATTGEIAVTTVAVASAPPVVTASEGTLSIAVSKTECGVTTVGPADLPLAPEGEFCLVTMAVRNTGKEPRLLDPGAQRAVDEHGRSHRVAVEAAVFVNDQDPSLLDEIPPGVTRHGVVPFDVPKGVRLAAFVLHKSPHSTGVRVSLS
jgi:hypothetical protein